MSDLPPNTVLVNSQQEEKIVLDPRSGEQRMIGAKTTVIAVDASGGRHVRVKDVTFRGDDERLINPNEAVFACCCGCGQTTLSRHSVVFCVACQHPVALSHERRLANNDPVCPAHAPRGLFHFLRNLCSWLRQAIS